MAAGDIFKLALGRLKPLQRTLRPDHATCLNDSTKNVISLDHKIRVPISVDIFIDASIL